MIEYVDLQTQVQSWIGDDSTETAAKIKRFANAHYRQIASTQFFRPLVSEFTMATSVLPGDMERPFYIQWEDSDYLIFPISQQDRYQSRKLYNWFTKMQTLNTQLSGGSDGVVTANSTAFTSASPDTDFDATSSTLVGEYLKAADNGGYYKIASVTDANTLVLTEKFRGASATGVQFRIRPEGTKEIVFSDYQGESVSSTTSVLYYQRVPLPLYNDYDMILLPGDCQAVVIATHQSMLILQKYDNDALKRQPAFDRALAKMEVMESPVQRSAVPRNQYGGLVASGYGHNRFPIRTNSANRRILGL